MSRKLAIKRLTASDLTFFEFHFRNNLTVKQKAINLNADVFVTLLYPGLGDSSSPRRLPIDIFIYGPGLKGAFNLQRKILKSPGAKNWRLNGEIVTHPDDPARFSSLAVNDFAIFDFNEGIEPKSASIIFVAAAVAEDRDFHQALNHLLNEKSMIALSPVELEEAATEGNLAREHPVYTLTVDTENLDPEVEDIALGGSGVSAEMSASGIGLGTGLIPKPTNRKMSRDDLQKVRTNADLIGLRGEQYVNDYLCKLKEEGEIRDFEWISFSNAISPYDFQIDFDETTKILVDVKSTQGEFDRVLHVSLNELYQMNAGPQRYDIYRVFEMGETSAKLRIAEGTSALAQEILEVLNKLPEKVFSDTVSFSPTILSFGPSINLETTDEMEEE